MYPGKLHDAHLQAAAYFYDVPIVSEVGLLALSARAHTLTHTHTPGPRMAVRGEPDMVAASGVGLGQQDAPIRASGNRSSMVSSVLNVCMAWSNHFLLTKLGFHHCK